MKLIKMALQGAKKGLKGAIEHSPVILAGAAVAGVVGVAIVAVKAGPKIKDIKDIKDTDLNDVKEQVEKKEISDAEAKKLRREIYWEFARKTFIATLPIAIAIILTILCILGLNCVHLKKQAAIAAAASLVESQSDEIVAKAKEMIGEEKFAEIEDAVFKDRKKKKKQEDPYNRDPNQDPDTMELPHGHSPIYDPSCGSYISGNEDTAKADEQWIRNQIQLDDELTLNDWHYHKGKPDIVGHNYIGFDSKDLKEGIRLMLRPSKTPGGRLCYDLKFDPKPHILKKHKSD